MNQTFGKEYKLCSKKLIDGLFQDSLKMNVTPFFVRFKITPLPANAPFQVAISIPKKKIKSAPNRNRMKRLIREVLRKNKNELEATLTDNQQQMALFLIYQDSEKMNYQEVEDKIVLLLGRLVNRLTQNT